MSGWMSQEMRDKEARLAATLTEAATWMRAEHGKGHKRQAMWSAMATMLDGIASDQRCLDDGTVWSKSIFWDAAKFNALSVADAYLAGPSDG